MQSTASTTIPEDQLAAIRSEQRKVAFEDAGRQYQIFERDQRAAVQQSQATIEELSTQVATLKAQLTSRDKAISRLERSLKVTQDALDREDREWEDEEGGYWGNDGCWYEYVKRRNRWC